MFALIAILGSLHRERSNNCYTSDSEIKFVETDTINDALAKCDR